MYTKNSSAFIIFEIDCLNEVIVYRDSIGISNKSVKYRTLIISLFELINQLSICVFEALK